MHITAQHIPYIGCIWFAHDVRAWRNVRFVDCASRVQVFWYDDCLCCFQLSLVISTENWCVNALFEEKEIDSIYVCLLILQTLSSHSMLSTKRIIENKLGILEIEMMKFAAIKIWTGSFCDIIIISKHLNTWGTINKRDVASRTYIMRKPCPITNQHADDGSPNETNKQYTKSGSINKTMYCAGYSSLLSAASTALIHLPSTFPMDIPSNIPIQRLQLRMHAGSSVESISHEEHACSFWLHARRDMMNSWTELKT